MKPLERWEPEDQTFWDTIEKRVSRRNLWISVPCLHCAFGVWLYWFILIVQMQNLGFAFPKTQLHTLPAIAGLSGATLRIPNTFLIALWGGREVIAVSTALLILPALGNIGMSVMQVLRLYKRDKGTVR